MKLSVLLTSTILLKIVSGSQLPRSLLSGNHWFSQKLDHFSNDNNKIWRQRYMVNSTFYRSGGPVFLIIGGEGTANPVWVRQGDAVHYGSKLNALIIQIEHRYYGESRPTKDLSVKNLKYLTTKQILADYAYFIESKNKELNSNGNVKWIAFGASYAGNLVTWLKQKYPKHLYGGVSSSGGILAKANLFEYLDSVRATLAISSKSCETSVKKSIQQIEKLLKSKGGPKVLDTKLKLCDSIKSSIDNPSDLSNLFEIIADNIASVVQYNKVNSKSVTVSVDDVCKVMVNKKIGSEFDRLAKVSKLILDENNQNCFDYKYEKMIQRFRNTSFDSVKAQEGWRQYYYASCNEIGEWQTSDSKNSIFGHRFPLKFFTKQCEDIFGPQFNANNLSKGVKRTNRIYLGKKPNTTNVVYVTGSRDPFRRVQLYQSNDPKITTIVIEGAAHVADVVEPSKKDSTQLKQARKKIFKCLKLLVESKSCVRLHQNKTGNKNAKKSNEIFVKPC